MSAQLAVSFSCPRCGTLGFKSRRALSTHLTFCVEDKPYILDRFLEGRQITSNALDATTNEKTLNQRIKEADKILAGSHISGFERVGTMLSTMPSIDVLGQSVDDMECPDILFANLDLDFNLAPIEDDTTLTNNLPTQAIPLLDSPGYFDRLKFEAEFHPAVLFQIHMEHAIHHHREVDKSVMDDVTKIIKLHASRGLDINTANLVPREELVKMIAISFNLHHLQPKIVKVPVSSGLASVGVFDLKSKILSILHNPDIMKPENIAEGYDIYTGRCDESDVYGEIHTGWLWEKAREHWCGDNNDIMPLGLVCFYDKTYTDVNGVNSTAPFIAVPSFLNIEERMRVEVGPWRNRNF